MQNNKQMLIGSICVCKFIRWRTVVQKNLTMHMDAPETTLLKLEMTGLTEKTRLAQTHRDPPTSASGELRLKDHSWIFLPTPELPQTSQGFLCQWSTAF